MKKVLLACVFIFLVALIGFRVVHHNDSRGGTASLETTVADFYRLLAEKKYAQAAELYDGTYDGLRGWNPEVAPNDFVTLWQNACEHNGLNCLPIQKIVSVTEKPLQEIFKPEDVLPEWRAKAEEYSNVYELTVEYQKPDGGTFEIGQCCGAPDTGVRTKDFSVIVAQKNGAYVVLTPPPYTP